MYWAVRTGVILRNTGELPIEIFGPDAERLLNPEQVADTVVQGIDAEQFLILPHPDVEQFVQFKMANYDRWLGGMRKLHRTIKDKIGSSRL